MIRKIARVSVLVMVAVPTVAVTAGCGGDKASDAPISSERVLEDVCEQRTYFTRAPAAAASPPRPLLVLEERIKNAYARELILQAAEVWRSADADQYQLVACATKADEGAKVKLRDLVEA